MKKLIAIGTIVRPWGIRGEVKIEPISKRIKEFAAFHELFAGSVADSVQKVSIERERPSGDAIIAKLAGVSIIDEAISLKGFHIFVSAEELDPLTDDEYYMVDLIGMKVICESGEEVGIVKDIVETGGTDVIIAEKEKKEVLIPLAKTICRRIDAKEGVITIDPPEGLLDLNEI